jgi:hypothetical protein
MPNFNRTLVTTYSKVYGVKKVINDEELSALDKNTWAKVLARLNHLARTETNYTIDRVVDDWFSRDNAECANEIFRKIVDGYRHIGRLANILIEVNIL